MKISTILENVYDGVDTLLAQLLSEAIADCMSRSDINLTNLV